MAAAASQPSDVAIGVRTCPVCVRAHALSEPRSRPRLARGDAAGARDSPSRLGIMAGITSPLWSGCRARRPGALEARQPPHVAPAGLGGCSDCARALDPVPWCGARHDDPRAQRLLRRGPHLRDRAQVAVASQGADAISSPRHRVAARHGRPASLAADQAVVPGVEPALPRPRCAGSHAGPDGLDRGRTPGRS